MTSVETRKFQSKVETLLNEINNFKGDNILLDGVKDKLEKNEKFYEEQLNETCNNLLTRGSLKVLRAYSRKCKKGEQENE